MNRTILLLIFSLMPLFGQASQWRTWTSTSGTTLDAKFVRAEGSSVVLERREGGQLTIRLAQLSSSDREFVKTIANVEGDSHTAEPAQNGWRSWTSTSGTTLDAKLVRVEGSSVVLERKEGGQLTVGLLQLSSADREFVRASSQKEDQPVTAKALGEPAPEKKGKTQIVGYPAQPGTISPVIKCRGKGGEWNYHVYLPKEFHDGRGWPVWFVMSAGGGKGGKALKRYVAGAERLGCVLALSVESKNSFADSDLAMEAMVDDVFKRLPVIDGLAFSTGMSGGSRMAYLMAEGDKRIAGILACGSGSGVYVKEKDFREVKLRGSTYVYSLIGTNCFNRTEAHKSHMEFPKDYRLRYFPGKHAWAGSPYIEEGMARVLGAGLSNLRGEKYENLRRNYALTMWAWTQEMVGSTPWEAYYWAGFLDDFKGDPSIREKAGALARTLKSDRKVGLALDAEKAIKSFGDKYFDIPDYTQDRKPNAKRSAAAERLTGKYSDIPHGDLIKLLGDKS